MIKHAIAFAFTALVALPAMAQAPATAPAAAHSLDNVEVGEKLAVYWDSPLYPQAAKTLNEQGVAEVRADYVNGVLKGEPAILASSRSPRLDQAALSVARQLAAVPEGVKPESYTKSLRFEIEFVRDSHLTLKSKTCQELSDDIAYARKLTPGLSLQQMRVYELVMGIYAIAYMQVSTQAAIKASQAMPKAYGSAVERCEASPAALFAEVLKEEMRKAM